MMAPLSLRALLRLSILAGLSAEVLEALQHAHEAADRRRQVAVSGPQAAAEIEAPAAQIIPSDDGPDAKEAGVIYLIDRALATFDHGTANSSGLVGRNLMVDTWAFAYGLFEHPLNELKGIQVTRVLHDFYEADPKRGFYGGAGIDGRFDYYTISFALDALPPDTPKWGIGFKKTLAEYFTRTHDYGSALQLLAGGG